MTLGALGDAALHLFTPFNIAVIFGGVTLGVIFGAIPGFTGSNTVAICFL